MGYSIATHRPQTIGHINQRAGNKKNHYGIPQPHFIPGYTGHCPFLKERSGKTYGHATLEVMEERPDVAFALKEYKHLKKPATDELSCSSINGDYESIDSKTVSETDRRKIYTDRMVSGYSGHIPLLNFVVGERFAQACTTGVSVFHRMNRHARVHYDFSQFRRNPPQKDDVATLLLQA